MLLSSHGYRSRPATNILEPTEPLFLPAGRADSGVFNIHLNVVWTCGLLDGIHIVALCSVAIRQFTDEEEWLQIRDKMQEFLGANEDLGDGS